MFLQIHSDILSRNDLAPIDKILLSKVREFCSNLGNCFPSHEYLSKFLGTSPATIKRSIKRLEQKGLIYISRPNRSRNNQYSIADCNSNKITAPAYSDSKDKSYPHNSSYTQLKMSCPTAQNDLSKPPHTLYIKDKFKIKNKQKEKNTECIRIKQEQADQIRIENPIQFLSEIFTQSYGKSWSSRNRKGSKGTPGIPLWQNLSHMFDNSVLEASAMKAITTFKDYPPTYAQFIDLCKIEIKTSKYARQGLQL